jgi:acyl-CoA synthetase (AMP-forming)/AMP-acid ligase II
MDKIAFKVQGISYSGKDTQSPRTPFVHGELIDHTTGGFFGSPQAPNFAYALAVRKFKEAYKEQGSSRVPELDLSSVKHMINAAEPVDVEAIADFYRTFGPFGLPDGVVIPTYGLAEHTVFVCSGGSLVVTVEKSQLEAGSIAVVKAESLGHSLAAAVPTDAAHQTIVSCGCPSRGEAVDVVIVNHETNEVVAENKVGEIWVRSPSKAAGYWNKEEQTREDFHAQIVATSSTDADATSSTTAATVGPAYLRTGDLGFLYEGELFICGRLKDLIIVRGSNHYPQDIERTAEKSHSSLRPGCSAAFAIKHAAGHTEAVVYVAEVRTRTLPLGFVTSLPKRHTYLKLNINSQMYY